MRLNMIVKWIRPTRVIVAAVMVLVLIMSFHLKSFSRTRVISDKTYYFITAKTNNIIPFEKKLQGQGLKSVSEISSFVKQRSTRELHLTLPFPKTTLTANLLLQQKWVKDLKLILSNISRDSPPIHIMAGNYEYRELLLNWLITAKVRVSPPVTNIVIVAIDSQLYELLKKRNISCLYVDWKTAVNQKLTTPFRLILILRLTVIRLLNYWGYDAANFDSDALILKNPEPLYTQFNNSDLVAGHGIFPFELNEIWGGTICGGTFMFRSTENSEIFWRLMSRVNSKKEAVIKTSPNKSKRKLIFDDQVLLNYALLTMDPVWVKTNKENAYENLMTATTEYGFTVTLIPEDTICRNYCDEQLQSRYYVWHEGGKKRKQSKTNKSEKARLWFLKKDWMTYNIISNSTGEQWLKEISDLHTLSFNNTNSI